MTPLVAAYVLIVMSVDMKAVEKELGALSTRIAERPMGLERSTDFIVYLNQALKNELLAGVPSLTEKLEFSVKSKLQKHMRQTLTLLKRDISNYVRPIVRRHQRFASRFPTVGGNLGSFIVLTSPSVDIEAAETEASLRGATSEKLSEGLIAIIMNNIYQFGDERLFVEDTETIDPSLRELFDTLEEKSIEPTDSSDEMSQVYPRMVIDKELFIHLTKNSINTAITILRDQMLEKLKINSSEVDN